MAPQWIFSIMVVTDEEPAVADTPSVVSVKEEVVTKDLADVLDNEEVVNEAPVAVFVEEVVVTEQSSVVPADEEEVVANEPTVVLDEEVVVNEEPAVVPVEEEACQHVMIDGIDVLAVIDAKDLLAIYL